MRFGIWIPQIGTMFASFRSMTPIPGQKPTRLIEKHEMASQGTNCVLQGINYAHPLVHQVGAASREAKDATATEECGHRDEHPTLKR
jgi:hypothetical protein